MRLWPIDSLQVRIELVILDNSCFFSFTVCFKCKTYEPLLFSIQVSNPPHRPKHPRSISSSLITTTPQTRTSTSWSCTLRCIHIDRQPSSWDCRRLSGPKSRPSTFSGSVYRPGSASSGIFREHRTIVNGQRIFGRSSMGWDLWVQAKVGVWGRSGFSFGVDATREEKEEKASRTHSRDGSAPAVDATTTTTTRLTSAESAPPATTTTNTQQLTPCSRHPREKTLARAFKPNQLYRPSDSHGHGHLLNPVHRF